VHRILDHAEATPLHWPCYQNVTLPSSQSSPTGHYSKVNGLSGDRRSTYTFTLRTRLRSSCIPPDHLEVLAADRDTRRATCKHGLAIFRSNHTTDSKNKQDRRHAASTSSSGPTCDICLQATQSMKEIENIKPTKIKHPKACKQQTNTRSQAVAR